jgi:hypothetical protein
MIPEKKGAVICLLARISDLEEEGEVNTINRHYALQDIRNFVAEHFSSKEIFLLKILYPKLQEYI